MAGQTWTVLPDQGEAMKVSFLVGRTIFPQESAKGRSECETLSLDESSGEVDCDPLVLRNVVGAYSHKCGRGRIWSRYRTKCVRKFF